MSKESAKGTVFWKVECFDADKNLKWVDEGNNLIVNEGLDYFLANAVSSATLYVGLTDGTPTPAAGDTMASHAGWAEITAYDEATRQTWTQGAVASQSVSNAASPATFTMNGTATVGGGFISTNNTKGGTTGTLFSVKAFNEGDRAVVATDTLNVTISVTMSSS